MPTRTCDVPTWTTRATSGDVVVIRPVHAGDIDNLRQYFRSLSTSSRYRRFMGAVNELSPDETARITGRGHIPTIAVVAEMPSDRGRSIIGEANCALDIDRRHGELAVSVVDRWQRHGIGFALLHVMECCAARLGLRRLCGEALESNDQIRGLARRAGFAVTRRPGAWAFIQLEKHLPSLDGPG